MSPKKIIFVEPQGAPSNIFSSFMNIPLLGPLQLATLAHQNGYEVTILNENMLRRQINKEELLNADILCVSCITATFNRGRKIAEEYNIQRQSHGLTSLAIIGGIHASMHPHEPGEEFNHIITGEAESVFLNVLNGQLTERIIHGSQLQNLDSIPLVNYSLLKNHHHMKIFPVMTSRGCPGHCNFCSVTKMFGRNYRSQSIPRILEELEKIKKGWIFFVDDNFAAIPSHTHKLLDELIKFKFAIPWTAQLRADSARDLILVKKMRLAGCKIVFLGLESINQSSLIQMKKNLNIVDITKAITIFQTNGIQVHGMFMLGNDPDSKDIFQATSSFSKKSGLSFVQYSVLTPLPGTELFTNLENEGRIIHKNWNLYDGLHVVFKPKNMSPVELQRGMIDCFKSFYSYPQALKTFFRILPLLRGNTRNTFYSAAMKIMGNSIIKKWHRTNQCYLSYLNNLQ